MKLFINNELTEFPEIQTVTELMEKVTIGNTRGLAIAINNEVIPKKQWECQTIKENDKITIIRATQGG